CSPPRWANAGTRSGGSSFPLSCGSPTRTSSSARSATSSARSTTRVERLIAMACPRVPATVEVGAAATLSGFHLGRTPVTNAEYAPFVASGHAPEPPWWRDPGFAAAGQPGVGVPGFEAADFAAWLAALPRRRWRLPTEAEWEHAARG